LAIIIFYSSYTRFASEVDSVKSRCNPHLLKLSFFFTLIYFKSASLASKSVGYLDYIYKSFWYQCQLHLTLIPYFYLCGIAIFLNCIFLCYSPIIKLVSAIIKFSPIFLNKTKQLIWNSEEPHSSNMFWSVKLCFFSAIFQLVQYVNYRDCWHLHYHYLVLANLMDHKDFRLTLTELIVFFFNVFSFFELQYSQTNNGFWPPKLVFCFNQFLLLLIVDFFLNGKFKSFNLIIFISCFSSTKHL
jgi:hypothetical protein